LGYDWLQKHNLVINWSKFTLLFERYPFSGRRMFWNRELEKEKKSKRARETNTTSKYKRVNGRKIEG